MKHGGKDTKYQSIMWGGVLIALGVVFLLDQLGAIELGNYGMLWWYWWPLMFVVIGLGQLVSPASIKQAASGFSCMLFGVWGLACMNHWYGLSWRKGWPIILVIIGLEALIVAVLERRSPVSTGKEVNHV